MAVEVFNLNYYIVQASAVDPDLAVTVGDTSMYEVTGSSPDRVFVQHSLRYLITGGPVPSLIAPKTKMFSITGPGPSIERVHGLQTGLWVINSGPGIAAAKIFARRSRLFAITA